MLVHREESVRHVYVVYKCSYDCLEAVDAPGSRSPRGWEVYGYRFELLAGFRGLCALLVERDKTSASSRSHQIVAGVGSHDASIQAVDPRKDVQVRTCFLPGIEEIGREQVANNHAQVRDAVDVLSLAADGVIGEVEFREDPILPDEARHSIANYRERV